MTATNAMLAHRYGYGLGRGPRRMPSRMQTSLMGTEEFGIDIPDEEFEIALRQVQGAAENLSRFKGERLPRQNKFRPLALQPMTLPAIPFGYGGIDGAVTDDMFGADDEYEDDSGDGGDEDLSAHEDEYSYSSSSSSEKTVGGKFKLPKLPGWALPAAAIAAGTAGAVGLGLALTSKKRKAKKAAKEASEAFGAMGDLVADSMFGDPDDDDEFGVDLLWPFPGPSSPQPPSLPPLPPSTAPAPSLPAASGMPSWSQYKAAQRDLYRATKKSTKASDRLAKAQSSLSILPNAPVFGFYGCNWNKPKTSFRGVRYGEGISDLQSFLASMPNTPSGLYDKSVELILTHFNRAYGSILGKPRALANKPKIEAQYQSFRQAAQADNGFGPNASAQASKGISLLEQITGTPVPSMDRQAMTAVARAQAALIARGLA